MEWKKSVLLLLLLLLVVVVVMVVVVVVVVVVVFWYIWCKFKNICLHTLHDHPRWSAVFKMAATLKENPWVCPVVSPVVSLMSPPSAFGVVTSLGTVQTRQQQTTVWPQWPEVWPLTVWTSPWTELCVGVLPPGVRDHLSTHRLQLPPSQSSVCIFVYSVIKHSNWCVTLHET